MKKVGRLLFVFFVMLLALTGVQFFLPVNADARLPGVAPGQFLHYSVNMTASGNDTELMAYVQQSQGWGNATVFSVSGVNGVNVTFQQVLYNATTNQSNTLVQNVENGAVNSSISLFPTWFIAANLSAGDPFYIGSGVPSINETVTADYLGQQLETNHLIVSVNQTNTYQHGYLTNVTMTEQLYWERKTGIMLDYNLEMDLNRPDGAGGVLIEHAQQRVLILSAVPSPPVIPEFPSFIILPLFMMATLIAAIAYRRRHSNKWDGTRFPVLSDSFQGFVRDAKLVIGDLV